MGGILLQKSTDSTKYEELKGTSGAAHVNVAAALPAGTNNIGDMDVLTEPATAADGAAGLPAVIKVMGGYDGANVQALSTDASGQPKVVLVGTNVALATLVSVASIAASGTSNAIGAAGTYATITGKKLTKLSLTCKVTYGTTATAGITVKVFTAVDDSGLTWDTDQFTSFAPDFVANTTHQKAFNLDPGALQYIGVQVTNLDGAVATGAVKVYLSEVD